MLLSGFHQMDLNYINYYFVEATEALIIREYTIDWLCKL